MSFTKPLHTLNARDHIMLEVVREHFKLSPARMFQEIQGMRRCVEEALADKNIQYEKLRSALVPSQNRKEVALIFDTTTIKSSWYGYDVMKEVIPLFEGKGNHSVLLGDYLDQRGSSDKLFSAFEEAVDLRRPVVYRHPTQFFIVYINNLTDAMVERFDKGLSSYAGYVGIADTTYTSRFKTYLSTMLVNSFIKHGRIILQPHEDDRPMEEDVNTSGYPFEESGYTCRSIASDLMGVLLSYKIERPIFPGFEVDTEFALNAVSANPDDIREFAIEVADAKIDYLKKAKASSLTRAGILGISNTQLAALIRSKIDGSYIYNLSADAEYNVTKFNIIIELPSGDAWPATRLLAALEYLPERKVLRLITLF
ncbi:hypothetical protein [Dongia sp.]|uniref:hypothetical protein n=1 Tax=Dongia sp. TaxID=1977262 RepID=UPI003750C954